MPAPTSSLSACVLYECLAAKKPFEGDSITAILSKILTESPPPLDAEGLSLPLALDRVLQRAMSKEPSQRFDSAGELVRAVRQSAEQGVAPAAPEREGSGTVVSAPLPAVAALPSAPGPVADPAGGRRRWVPVAAGLAAALLVGSFVGVQALRSPSTPPPAPQGEAGALVVEEQLGFVGRMLGRQPRVFITVPAATGLALELQTSLSSATSNQGDAFTAEVREPVEVEEVEAVRAGARVFGHLSSVTPAEEAKGRGALTLEFDSVTLADGRELEIDTAPLVLRAPPGRGGTRRGSLPGSPGRARPSEGSSAARRGPWPGRRSVGPPVLASPTATRARTSSSLPAAVSRSSWPPRWW